MAAKAKNRNPVESSVLPVSQRLIELDHADGLFHLVDTEGKRYLDFAAGIATSSFGNCNPELLAAAIEQLQKLGHTSSSHGTKLLETVSRTLADTLEPGAQVFWANCGATANEGALIAMCSYQHENGHPERDMIITFQGAFHGRTLRTREAAGKYVEGIGKVTDGFKNVPFNDLAAVEAAIDGRTAGIFLELVQGEGGIRQADPEFVKGLRKLCDEKGLVLGVDEVQTGIGRTGKMYAFDHYGIKPDVFTVAKAISGGTGIAVGAFVVGKKIADGLTGNGQYLFAHGSTYGGGPVALAVAGKALEMVKRPEFMGPDAQDRAAFFAQQLELLVARHPELVKEARGIGFMRGLKINDAVPVADMVFTLRDAGLFTMFAGDNVLRLVPPLNMPKELMVEAAKIMDTTFRNIARDKLGVKDPAPEAGAVNAEVAVLPDPSKSVPGK